MRDLEIAACLRRFYTLERLVSRLAVFLLNWENCSISSALLETTDIEEVYERDCSLNLPLKLEQFL